MLLVAGVSATIVVVFIISLIWGFIALALFVIVTFFELEKRERELEEISDYINVEVGRYLSNHSLSIGLAFTVIGICLLSPAYLIKGAAYWYEWQKEVSRTLHALQLPFFVVAILFLAVGLILTNKNSKGSEKR